MAVGLVNRPNQTTWKSIDAFSGALFATTDSERLRGCAFPKSIEVLLYNLAFPIDFFFLSIK